jgi:hypothetical protein
LYTTLAFAAGNVGLVNSTPSHVCGTANKSLGWTWFTGRDRVRVSASQTHASQDRQQQDQRGAIPPSRTAPRARARHLDAIRGYHRAVREHDAVTRRFRVWWSLRAAL